MKAKLLSPKLAKYQPVGNDHWHYSLFKHIGSEVLIKPAEYEYYDVCGHLVKSKYLQMIDSEHAILLRPDMTEYLIESGNPDYNHHWVAFVYEELAGKVVDVEHSAGRWYRLKNVPYSQNIDKKFLQFASEMEI